MATHAVSVSYNLQLDVLETLDLALDLGVGTPRVTHQIASPAAAGTLNATSTPVASQVASDAGALTAGAATIDLTAAPSRDGGTVDLTGLKVQAVKIACPATNTAAVVVAVGASNGYHLFGDGDGQIAIPAGGQVLFIAPEGLPDVGAAACEIDLASADADAAYSIILVAG